ncbi:hypothetical protein BX666DRAFT_868869 [Dichotomocladium elegans]|nr:hypothetical protein BX666DRAFT_868869 [Dichotomocladium elegans]
MLLGYHDTRDVISLYSKGTGGLSEFRTHLSDEVLYGFVRVDDRFILITWVSAQVSGVRRARALVHSRAVANLLKSHHAQLTASSMSDVSDNNIRTRLKLGEKQVPNRSRPLSMSERKRASMSKRRTPTPDQLQQQFQHQQQQFQEQQQQLLTEEPESFVEANETSPRQETAASPKEQQQPVVAPPNNDQDIQIPLLAEESKKKIQQASIAAGRDSARREKEEQQQEQERIRRAEVDARLRAEQEASAQRVRVEEEMKRQEAEKRRLMEEEEHRRREAQAMKYRMQEADMVLAGYVSVQPQPSPFWRRRFMIVRDRKLVLYRDELSPTPVGIIDLKVVVRLSQIDPDRETFLPNSFVLETKANGSFKISADNRTQCHTIFAALQTVAYAQ